MTKFCVSFGEREPRPLTFRVVFWNWTLSLHTFIPIGALNRSTQLRHSKVKYKSIFYKASSSVWSSSLLKLPNAVCGGRKRKNEIIVSKGLQDRFCLQFVISSFLRQDGVTSFHVLSGACTMDRLCECFNKDLPKTALTCSPQWYPNPRFRRENVRQVYHNVGREYVGTVEPR